jgi:hypothetical protein
MPGDGVDGCGAGGGGTSSGVGVCEAVTMPLAFHCDIRRAVNAAAIAKFR